MKLLEIVRAEKTSPEVLATAIDTAKRIKKLVWWPASVLALSEIV